MKKTILITGASDGLGKALTKLLVQDYSLIICGRSESKMKQLLQEINCDDVYYECFDITNEDARTLFCDRVKAKYDRIDVVINNAGANTKKDQVVDIDLNDLRYMFELNVVSALAMIQAFYPLMKKQKSGLFVNILSTCCLFSNQKAGSYSASKSAFESISKILLKEAREDHIGVCNVYPGGIDTNFRAQANPDYLKAESVAKMIQACIENEDGCVHDIVIRPFIEENMA